MIAAEDKRTYWIGRKRLDRQIWLEDLDDPVLRVGYAVLEGAVRDIVKADDFITWAEAYAWLGSEDFMWCGFGCLIGDRDPRELRCWAIDAALATQSK